MLKQQILASPWASLLSREMELPYFATLERKVAAAYETESVCPQKEHVLRVLQTPPDQVKVVIIGQDPYHTRGQAMGLSFSMKPGCRLQPSLITVFNELRRSYSSFQVADGDLTGWQHQGVFLLNNLLTVREGQPESHESFGWQRFTDAIVKLIDQHSPGAVWMLWGQKAQRKKHLINQSKNQQGVTQRDKHKILTGSHPSPMTTGFAGCNHFLLCNAWLSGKGFEVIKWSNHRAPAAPAAPAAPHPTLRCCGMCSHFEPVSWILTTSLKRRSDESDLLPPKKSCVAVD